MSFRMPTRFATATRPGTSRSASARNQNYARATAATGSTAWQPSTRTSGRRSTTCSSEATRRARCGSPGQSGCTGRPVATGQKGGDTSATRSHSARAPPPICRWTRCGVARSSPSGRATSTTPRRKRPDSGSCRRTTRTAAGLAAHHIDGVAAAVRGDNERARSLLEEGAVLARNNDDEWLLSVALNNLGSLHLAEGDYARAIELFEESLAIGEARGDLDRRARQLVGLGIATYGLGDIALARERFSSGLAAAREIGLVEAELNALLGLAACEAESGDPATAARIVGWYRATAARLNHSNATQPHELRHALRANLDESERSARSRRNSKRS